jgi:hypothetical protein
MPISARKKTTPAAMAIEIRITIPVARKRRRLKLKVVNEWKRLAIDAGAPVAERAVIKGMRFCPSKRAEEATPKPESAREPDIMRTLSGSITPFEECWFCTGTMINWETLEEPCNVEAKENNQSRSQTAK